MNRVPRANMARSLRARNTTAEKIMWRHLRNRQMNGYKWRRQLPIDQYIVDFCCPELRIIVEILGDVHGLKLAEDAKRQAYLESQGFTVVCFANSDVFENLSGVLETLWQLSSRGTEA